MAHLSGSSCVACPPNSAHQTVGRFNTILTILKIIPFRFGCIWNMSLHSSQPNKHTHCFSSVTILNISYDDIFDAYDLSTAHLIFIYLARRNFGISKHSHKYRALLSSVCYSVFVRFRFVSFHFERRRRIYGLLHDYTFLLVRLVEGVHNHPSL